MQVTWSRVMGYVQQTDIHSPTVTVAESLMFSARLRLPRNTTDAAVSFAVAATSPLPLRCCSFHSYTNLVLCVFSKLQKFPM